jgi:hypothetical protein
MYIQCRDCSEIFYRKSQRGRPPVRCGACEEKALPLDDVKLANAKARVDRLEMLLKSRNNHISQNRKDWE